MKRWETWRYFVAIGVMLLFVLNGCGRDSEPKSSKAPPAVPVRQNEAEDEMTPAADAINDEDPAAEFVVLRDSIVQGNEDGVVAWIPEAWFDNVAVASRPWMAIEPQARETFVMAMARVARAIDAKADTIASSEIVVFDGPWAGLLNKNLASLARVIGVVAEWPGWLGTGEFDAQGFVRAVVASVSAESELIAAVKELEFENVSGNAESGKLRYRSGDEGEWVTFPITRYEGQWIPTRLLEVWKRVRRAESSAGVAPGRLSEIAVRLEALSRALEGVSTQADFDALAEGAAKTLLADEPTADAGPRPVGDQEFAWVIVSGTISETETDQLLWNIAGRTDAPTSAVADLRSSDDGNGVRIRVGPVADLQAFAGRLKGLTIENVDEKKRTIMARVERDRSPE